MKVTIYDDDGRTFDRYTVICKDGSVYGMSHDPFYPQGFCQYCGDLKNFKHGLTHTGKLVKFTDLPKDVKLAIRQRQNPAKYRN